MLLPLIMSPVLLFGLAEPRAITPLVGRSLPAGPMLLVMMTLLLLPPAALVLKRTLPVATPTAPVEAPRMVQFFTMLFAAPLMKRIVLVPAVGETVVFVSVSEPPMPSRLP